jgi:hypothetical protein
MNNKQHVYQKSQHQNATFSMHLVLFKKNILNCTMITDKYSQTLIFWCQKISFSDLKLEDTPSVLQHWAVWLIIIKFIKQKWTLQECFPLKKKTSKVVTTRPRSTAKTSLNVKSPFKINDFVGLEKFCHTFSQTFLWNGHDTTHQTSTENDPQNIVTHRIWQSTIRHTYRHSPYLTKPKGQIPTLNLPSFQKQFF